MANKQNFITVNMPSLLFDTDVKGTRGEDVLTILRNKNLSDLHVKRTELETFEIGNSPNDFAKIILKGFDACIDIIRTDQGDFTLAEILAYGNNAPFHKQARANAELLNPEKPLPPVPGCRK